MTTATLEKPILKDAYTSTGAKFFYHEEAMRKLRNGQGMPITTHLMPTDICQHTCAFCSVATRDGSVLPAADMLDYVDILRGYGLKSVIISGGGNPILYKDPQKTGGFNELVWSLKARGLEIGLITNGMPMKQYDDGRMSWRNVHPDTLDMLTWVRISMSGLDHKENEVFVPDIDPSKTTLGFSYVLHDIFDCPEEKNHHKVSTIEDIIRLVPYQAQERVDTIFNKNERVLWGGDRMDTLKEQIAGYVQKHKPRYVRLLPNCLQPSLIASRCRELQHMADQIDPQVVFVQNKPPNPHTSCTLGYIHPVLNSDGFIYPCDSVVLNEAAGHKFAEAWRICHWKDIRKLYDAPVRSLIDNPQKQCPGCVFGQSNRVLAGVVDGTADIAPPAVEPIHSNFV